MVRRFVRDLADRAPAIALIASFLLLTACGTAPRGVAAASYGKESGNSLERAIPEVSLDPEGSAAETIESLEKRGYACKADSSPQIVQRTDEQYVSAWAVEASPPNGERYAFKLTFSVAGLWSYEKRGAIEKIEKISTGEKSATAKAVPSLRAPNGSIDDRSRALDLAIALSRQNSTGYDRIMPIEDGKRNPNPKTWKDLLQSSWAIDSREKYFASFDDLVANGHTKAYRDAMRILDENPHFSPAQITLYTNNSDYYCDRLFYVRATREWLGERSLRAWDLGRLISVTRWAYAAGYITEDEAWQRILPIAQSIYETYASREDFLVSYAGGRGFFGADDAPRYVQAMVKIYSEEMGKPSSRQHLPWDAEGADRGRVVSRAAQLSDLAIRRDAEWDASDELFKRINREIARISDAEKSKDYGDEIEAVEEIKTILVPLKAGEFFPPLYYQARYAEGMAYLQLGRKDAALVAFREIARAYPKDENVRNLIQQCVSGLPEA